MPHLPLVAIVGRPNVGKSTLFNRLVGRRRAIVTDEPGVTRDRLYGKVSDAEPPFRVVDTGGLAPGQSAPFSREIEGQADRALAEAAAVLLVVDARDGPTALDRALGEKVRRLGVPVRIVANKVDHPSVEPLVAEFFSFGFGEPIPVSAEHGLGLEALLEEVARMIGPSTPRQTGDEPPADPPIRVAIVGRPNVGKSSLLNRLAGEERTIVSEIPGTTRDSVDTLLVRGGRSVILVDTAGIRRRGRVRAVAESLSVSQAHRSIERADVVVLVLDATAPLAAQDTHVAGYAHEAFKPVVIAVNKWDRIETREEAAKAWEEEIRTRLRFFKDPHVVFVSARSGQRVGRILDLSWDVHAVAGKRVATPALNRWLQEQGRAERESPARGGSVKLFYATQTGVHPPRFVLFCNDARRIHFSLRRRLENSLRERFGFGSVPLRLGFRSRREAASP